MLILQEESDYIKKLKELCCFKLSGNKYQIKLGVKLAVNNFIQSLKAKEEQQKRKKRSSKQYLSSDLGMILSTNERLPQKEEFLSQSSSSMQPAGDTVSRQPKEKKQQQILDELGHIAGIEQRLQKW